MYCRIAACLLLLCRPPMGVASLHCIGCQKASAGQGHAAGVGVPVKAPAQSRGRGSPLTASRRAPGLLPCSFLYFSNWLRGDLVQVLERGGGGGSICRHTLGSGARAALASRPSTPPVRPCQPWLTPLPACLPAWPAAVRHLRPRPSQVCVARLAGRRDPQGRPRQGEKPGRAVCRGQTTEQPAYQWGRQSLACCGCRACLLPGRCCPGLATRPAELFRVALLHSSRVCWQAPEPRRCWRACRRTPPSSRRSQRSRARKSRAGRRCCSSGGDGSLGPWRFLSAPWALQCGADLGKNSAPIPPAAAGATQGHVMSQPNSDAHRRRHSAALLRPPPAVSLSFEARLATSRSACPAAWTASGCTSPPPCLRPGMPSSTQTWPRRWARCSAAALAACSPCSAQSRTWTEALRSCCTSRLRGGRVPSAAAPCRLLSLAGSSHAAAHNLPLTCVLCMLCV